VYIPSNTLCLHGCKDFEGFRILLDYLWEEYSIAWRVCRSFQVHWVEKISEAFAVMRNFVTASSLGPMHLTVNNFQVSHYLEDEQAFERSAAWLAQKLRAGHPDSEHAIAELRNLQSAQFARAVLLAAGETAGQALELLPPELHREALAARMHERRFVQGLAFQGGCSSFADIFTTAVPHLHDIHWLDLSGNNLSCATSCMAATTSNCSKDEARPGRTSSSSAEADSFHAVCPYSSAFSAATAAEDEDALVQPSRMAKVAEALATLTSLQSLDLTGNCLQPEAATPLAKCLPQLRYLQVRHNFLSSARIHSCLTGLLMPVVRL
jgi:hypothetical protein